jgi:hypothetical protein
MTDITMIPFQCPHCAGMFQISADLAGQAVACPHCNGGVLIPEMSAPAGPPENFAPGSPEMASPVQPTVASTPPLNIPASNTEPPPLTAFVPPTATSGSPQFAPEPVNEVPAERMFVIPTIDGGQAVIRKPTKVAVSGGKQRRLRDLSYEEKSTRRVIKNWIIFGSCAVLLGGLLWWLLNRG